LDLSSEPQPDLVLLRPEPDFYASRLPGPADILLIVEVAESSIDYDSDVKAGLYATAGVREYWLVDLTTGTVTRASAPSGGAYQRHQQHRSGESIAPDALPLCGIPVEALLAGTWRPQTGCLRAKVRRTLSMIPRFNPPWLEAKLEG
ncbi:MAG: Uma2 family endonuclease, partial [Acidobacteriota bacterium]|nr:Uma2 family endonuclease [Acidobacteriota bacterium]